MNEDTIAIIIWGAIIIIVIAIILRRKYWKNHPEEYREYKEAKRERKRREAEERRQFEREKKLAYHKEQARLQAEEDWKRRKELEEYHNSGQASRDFRRSTFTKKGKGIKVFDFDR